MFLKNSLLSVALFSSFTFTAANAADGTININGQIIAAGCEVTTTDQTQTISLGTVAESSFGAVGSTASSASFSISMENCPAALTNARVVFDGNRDTSDFSLLRVDGDAAGVAIAVFDARDDSRVPLGVASNPATVTGENAILNFNARYQKTAANITPGQANGVLSFTVQYQ